MSLKRVAKMGASPYTVALAIGDFACMRYVFASARGTHSCDQQPVTAEKRK